jgi:peptide/nickel transport system permease protein
MTEESASAAPRAELLRRVASRVRWRDRPLIVRVAVVILLVYAVAAVGGEWLAPYSPTQVDTGALLRPPSWAHPFGTDGYGRDVFSRVIVGTGTILLLSLSATLLGVGVGTAVGLVSGYRGAMPDEIVMRAMDILMALPALLLALLVVSSLGASKPNLVLAIALVWVPKSARVARSAVLAVRRLGFVEAARLRGQSLASILFLELLPNVRDVVVVEFCLRFAYSLLLISSLGFLGFGVRPPTPDWGLMITEGRNYTAIAPWVVLFPALAIGILVVAVNIIADGLWRDRRRISRTLLV